MRQVLPQNHAIMGIRKFKCIFQIRMERVLMCQFILKLIIKKIFSKMFSRCTSFRDLDFDNIQEQPCQFENGFFNAPSYYEKGTLVAETSYGSAEPVQEFVMSRNCATDVRDYEISFQSNFLQEHQNAFQKQSENFMEASLKNCQNKKTTFETKGLFGTAGNSELLSHIEDNSTFKEATSKFEKLGELFNFVQKTVPQEVYNELIFCSLPAVEQFSQKKELEKYVSTEDIARLAKNITEENYRNFFNDQRINFLNLRAVPKELKNQQILVQNAFKDFLEFFLTTAMLVSEEYFENDFTRNEESKRPRGFSLEDDEEDESSANSVSLGKASKRTH